jgi:hypothetical protein
MLLLKGIRNYLKSKCVFFSVLVFLGNYLNAQTYLNPGDIVITALKTNNSTQAGNDAVKFVTLVDLDCNTQFIITDNNWNGSTWSCDDDEFGVQVTCVAPIAAGSVFYLDVDAAGNALFCSGGTVMRTDLGSPWGSNFGFNSGGDNLYILQGNRANPIFIFAYKHVGAFSSSDCSSKDNASLPAGLSLGSSAIVMPSSKNQWNYNCVINNGSRAVLLSAITNSANWISNSNHMWDASNCVFTVSSGFIPYGVLAVAGSGCGCLANCQLAYSGGVNCGSAGVSGDCAAGYQNMTATIVVPAGCTYNVVAQMKARTYGCTASGADGNCQSCDVLKVDIPSGTKSFQQGGSNASLTDNYSLTGPGTIVVSGKANRADEIITYGIQSTPCGCIQNLIVLPIELISFAATQINNSVAITWTTASEINNEFFTVERSQDAENWNPIFVINGQGNSTTLFNYSVFDSSPLDGVSYYRLKQTDFMGESKYSTIIEMNIVRSVRKISKQVNMFGQEIDEFAPGIHVIIYDNGETEKIIRLNP